MSVRFDPPKTHASGCSLPGAICGEGQVDRSLVRVGIYRARYWSGEAPWQVCSAINLIYSRFRVSSTSAKLGIWSPGGRDRSGQIVDLYRVPAFLTHPNRIEGPTVRCGWSFSNHAVFEFTNQNLRQPNLVADSAIYANGNPGEVPGPKEWMCGFEDFGDETTFF